MYRRTADAGDPYALGLAARLLEDAGRLNEAIGLSQAHARAGPPSTDGGQPYSFRTPPPR